MLKKTGNVLLSAAWNKTVNFSWFHLIIILKEYRYNAKNNKLYYLINEKTMSYW